ncbi:hypothetical protein M422DRAFT_268357 [Sphaerobolus stellatus SS14]|uniref:Uncharacterized protein n=1 Tax=Sphaerobolus stellatus (strain SS14) TaxID=990650 RepID=A0A0C9U704_SPHS4|nr:hypothetical protein M422DRAFT_268357 [Sphaerobolus stellatus SS14]
MVWVASLVKAAPAERPLTCFASSLIDHSASSSIEHYYMDRIRPHEGHISLNSVYRLSEEPRHAGSFSTSPPRAVKMDSPSLSPLHSIETQGYVLNDLTSDTSFQSPENSPRTVLPPFLSGINVSSTSTRLPSIFLANYALDYLHNRYRKLANRNYYPSPHHQTQFDTLQHHDPFAGDDVVQDFAKLKKREMDQDAPREEDNTLPGWGSWGGRGVKRNPTAKNVIKKVAGIVPTARADHGQPHVIISEKKDKKAAKYLVKDLPYP